jgi:hypothetical protein
MAANLYGGVWALDLTHDEQSVLLVLADNAKHDGSKAFPSVAYIAWALDYSQRQIQRTLKTLRDRGIVEPTAFSGGGRGHPTEYSLHLEKAPQKVPWRIVRDSRKGDTGVATDAGKRVTPESQQRVTPESQLLVKGDISGSERVTFSTPEPVKGDISGIKGDTAVSPDPLDPGYVDPGYVDPGSHGAFPAPPATDEIDEEFIAKMTERFGAQLGGEIGVRERIAEALNHTASRRWKDKRLGVQGWLRRDAEKTATARGGRGYGRPRAGVNPGDAGYEDAAAWEAWDKEVGAV